MLRIGKAAGWNRARKVHYKVALEFLIERVEDMSQIIVIDETHKDKRASKRRQAWGRWNSGGVALRRWYYKEINYIMITAMNIDGLVDETVNLYLRDEISEEGAAGTVDGKTFLNWVNTHLVKVLGNHKEREKIALSSWTMLALIWVRRQGNQLKTLELIYYIQLHIHLICRQWSIALICIKLTSKGIQESMIQGIFFIYSITADIVAFKEFRKCGIPYSEMVLISDERVNVIE